MKVAIVTGASRGLGKQIALKFGREGWGVLVNYLNSADEAASVCEEIISAGGDACSFKADVCIYSEVNGMVQAAISRWGRLDVLVNNAGITRDFLIAKTGEDDWDSVLDTDLKAAFNTTKASSKAFIKARSGHIINISSISGVRGKAGQAAYSAAKAGLIGLTRATAVELATWGIQANAVLPGFMLTDMIATMTDVARENALSNNLLKKFSDPEEVADFIFHIAEMKAVSGQVFNLDSRII
ncbi:MAG TPA: SDR family NAD(P)-dependent oxidoreductase [Nitrospirota bacterium]|jgi:3-oxoacyl-[acyl-carrier protein] reductase